MKRRSTYAMATEHPFRQSKPKTIVPSQLFVALNDPHPIDFGAANEFIGTATGTLIGKQAYIAPEQLRGKASCQSDLYSLGATIYFLLTGREPLPLSRSSPRLLITDMPSSIDQLVMDLTELEPTERIQSADELVDRLAHVLAES